MPAAQQPARGDHSTQASKSCQARWVARRCPCLGILCTVESTLHPLKALWFTQALPNRLIFWEAAGGHQQTMGDRSLLQQAMRVLEWDRVLEILAGQARSSMGAERCRTIPLETDLDAAEARLQETREMVSLEERGDPFPSLPFPDLREALGSGSGGPRRTASRSRCSPTSAA